MQAAESPDSKLIKGLQKMNSQRLAEKEKETNNMIAFFTNSDNWEYSGRDGIKDKIEIPPEVYYVYFHNPLLDIEEVREALQRLPLVADGTIQYVEGSDDDYVAYTWRPE